MGDLITATINWFDGTSGEGTVRLNTGEVVYLHFTAIQGINNNNYQWPTQDDQVKLEGIKGRPCKVRLYTNLYSTQVEYCELIAHNT